MCDCTEKLKQDLGLVKNLAEKFTNIIQDDVRIYSKQGRKGLIYDFEPSFVNNNIETEIAIIIFDKSKTIE